MNQKIQPFVGNDRLLLAMVLAVITFWLFAQTMINLAPTIQHDIGIDAYWMNVAVSITALFSGIFVVVFGGLADRFGRVKVAMTGIVLNIIGCLFIILTPHDTAVFLMAGRIIQGLSAACIMPATLALIKTYYDGAHRQRAVSFWVIGAWGGSGLCSLFGGAVASAFGWDYIFIGSIVVSLLSLFLLKGTPESKVESVPTQFDWSGLASFLVALVSLNIIIGQGAKLGWTHPVILGLAILFVVGAIVFFIVESKKTQPFVDFSLFKNKTYAGATLSNFLINTTIGTLIVTLALLQKGAGKTPFEAGLVTLGYLIAVLATIRVGEKLLQLWGPRKPMIMGCCITACGIFINSFSFLYTWQYMIATVIGFALFGVGLGFYATPSTDAALSNVPQDQAGAAAGIYKMASTLGSAFGIALSATIFTALSTMVDVPFADLFVGRVDNIPVRFAAMIALWFNVCMTLIAITSIIVTVPKNPQN